MLFTHREIWTAVHGLFIGSAFLLAFAGGFVTLCDLGRYTPEGGRRAGRRLVGWTWAMAVLAWVTVGIGTFGIYPWYRAKPPAGVTAAADLGGFPKFKLLAAPRTAGLHEFGMEWKEHVAWVSPIAATAVAAVATRYRRRPGDLTAGLRRATLFLYAVSFAAAAVAGLLGAVINKVAPVQ